MNYRSWLIVAGDDEDLLGMSVSTRADVMIVDLSDRVSIGNKRRARAVAAEWLQAHRRHVLEQRMGRWVRINSMDSGLWRDDLATVMPAAPDGIVLPGASGPDAVRLLAAELYEIEQRQGIPPHATRIMPVVGETPQAAMSIATYLETGHQRLAGLTWDTQELAAGISAVARYQFGRGWGDPFGFVRAQALLTAHASGVMALDAPCRDAGDEAAFLEAARASRADGFTGMMATHRDQVPLINQAFTASADETREARDIVEAFEANPDKGALQYKGRMIDRPHLMLARRTLGLEPGEKPGLQRSPILRPA